MTNSRGQDGRGRSPGSRANQFSKDKQPDRASERRRKVPEDAAEMLHRAMYEKISTSRRGRRTKIPFIEALIQTIRKNALEAKLPDQIKYFKEIKSLGIMDIEKYKEKIFKGINNRFKKTLLQYDKMSEFIDKIGKEYRRVFILYILYLNLYFDARARCKCGSWEEGFDRSIGVMTGAIERVANTEDEYCDGFDEGPEREDGPEANEVTVNKVAPPTGQSDDDLDNEFYRGMGLD